MEKYLYGLCVLALLLSGCLEPFGIGGQNQNTRSLIGAALGEPVCTEMALGEYSCIFQICANADCTITVNNNKSCSYENASGMWCPA